jgi:antitoxin VapB
MAINIKNETTEKLARQLAKLTGESISTAVTRAVHERLERVQEEEGIGLAERLLRIGQDCAAHLPEPFRSVDPGEMLYNEKGLPK